MEQFKDQSKEQLQDLLDNLRDLRDNQGFRACQDQFSLLLAQSSRLLESQDSVTGLYRAQGECRAYRKACSIVDDLVQSVKKQLKSLESPNAR